MQKAIIVDLDNTLFNVDYRNTFLRQFPKDWPNYKCAKNMKAHDKINPWCREIVDRFAIDHRIIFVSGRSAEPGVAQVTRELIAESLHLPNGYDLHLRDPSDLRADTELKSEVYIQFIYGQYDVLFALDDRDRIVDLWRGLGLTCLHC